MKNNQHPTSNNQWFPPRAALWVFDVERWLLDVFPF
jgi:hypothetical protein